MVNVTNDNIDLREESPRAYVAAKTVLDNSDLGDFLTEGGRRKVALHIVDQPKIDLGDGSEKFAESGMSSPCGFIAKASPQSGTEATGRQLIADLWSEWLSVRLNQTINLSAEDVCLLLVLLKTARLAHRTQDEDLVRMIEFVEAIAHLGVRQRNYR